MKYTGKALHGKFIMNVRISMLRDIEKLTGVPKSNISRMLKENENE